MTEHRDRWTMLVCPKCGSHVPYSAMDQSHGFTAGCGCESRVEMGPSGYMEVVGRTSPVAVEVQPVNPEWRDAQ